jgi:hypothetical protein
MHLAAVVSDAWLSTRGRLVSEFLAKLRERLESKLKGWRCTVWRQFFVDPYCDVYLLKPSWDKQYYITLQCSDHGEKMELGVQRDETHVGKRPFCPEILAAVKEHYPSARSRIWWEAVTRMQSPAADWRKPEVLWRMHKDDKFLDDVAEQLHEVAQATEAILDRLVQKQ